MIENRRYVWNNVCEEKPIRIDGMNRSDKNWNIILHLFALALSPSSSISSPFCLFLFSSLCLKRAQENETRKKKSRLYYVPVQHIIHSKCFVVLCRLILYGYIWREKNTKEKLHMYIQGVPLVRFHLHVIDDLASSTNGGMDHTSTHISTSIKMTSAALSWSKTKEESLLHTCCSIGRFGHFISSFEMCSWLASVLYAWLSSLVNRISSISSSEG